MIALALLLAQAASSSVGGSKAVFACFFTATAKSDPDRHVLDLRADQILDARGERWLLSWADGRSALAEAREARFGSVGRSIELNWTNDKGQKKRAFVSYSDVVMANGQKAMFLSLDKPSLWQPPGYVCSTAALEENRQ